MRDQGAGADRRPRQGRRDQGRRGRRARRASTPTRSSAWTSRPARRGPVPRPPGLGRGRLGDRRRVLRLDHPRPLARRSCWRCSRRWAAWTSRRSPRRTPTRWSGATSTRPRASTPPRRGAIAADAGIDEDVRDKAAEMLVKLARGRDEEDATLIEVNPLIVTADREVVALDAKVTIDGNALFRHEDLAELDDDSPRTRRSGWRRRRASPTSSSTATSASSATAPGSACRPSTSSPRPAASPANFLDAGGGSKAEAIVDALEVITSDEKVTRDPLQHLRRHHPLRRDRQGDHRGLAADRDRACRWSSASTAPTPRRGSAARRGRPAQPAPGEDDARRGREGRRARGGSG